MSASHVEILALTSDEQLLQALEDAVHGEHRVHRASTPVEAAELAAANLVGVLVTDVALEQLALVIAPLEMRAPGLVTIVASDRDRGNELLELTNSGPVFRFLLKPFGTGQLRLYVEAAVKHHLELLARGPQPMVLPAPPPEPSAWRKWRFAAAGVVGLVAMLSAWLLTSQPQEVTLGAHDRSAAPTATATATAEIDRLLVAARQAEREDRLVEPPQNNALDLYARVLALKPNQLEASEKLTQIADRMFDRAETALANGRLDVARKAIANAKRALPGHPRLAYFNTRLEAEEQRAMITQALQAARGGDMTEAAGLIDEAARVRLGESGAVTEARAELARRGEAQARRDAYLRLAQTRTSEGQLVEPAEDNALFYVQTAQHSGASPAELAPTVDALVAAMLAQAASAAQAEHFDVAEEWLARARELTPEAEALAPAQIDLAASMDRSQRLARWLELASERLDRGQLDAPDEDSAEHYLTMIRKDAPDYPGLAASLARLAQGFIGAARSAIAAGRLDEAGRQLDAARALDVPSSDLMLALGDYAAAKVAAKAVVDAAAVAAKVAAVAKTPSHLVRRKYVAPHYPDPAARKQIEGRVELELTVDATGKVKGVEVTNAQPPDTFERAAIAAAKQWEYQPAEVDGTPVEARTLVAIDFSLE